MKKKIRMVLLVVVTILIDQIVKGIIISQGDLNFRIIPGILQLSYVENKGGAYGLGADSILVLIGINLLLVVGITRYLVKNYKVLNKNLTTGLLLVLSGGISNLIDRLFRGYVIDYLDITEILNFPVFNIADSLIVVGAVIMIVTILIDTVREQETAKKG